MFIECLEVELTPGPDGFHSTVLKQWARDLAKSLFMIFQASLATGELPEIWRRANVSCILKKGCKIAALYCKPTSPTSVLCELRDKIL